MGALNAAPSLITVMLASPRGFCAGVDRAVQIVEQALSRFGPPVYVRHQIVHNRFVVEQLEARGAVFVSEVDEVPPDRPVVFSAHGVPPSVRAAATARGLACLDATCPLVTKVHREAVRHAQEGRRIVMIGHAGHPEVIGTMGQVDAGRIVLVQTVEDARTVDPGTPDALAYITQTTLSLDDAAAIVAVLRRRFPAIHGPHGDDICYATTNRQRAVKDLAAACDAVMVIGSPNSSNSQRLVEVAKAAGCGRATLIGGAAEIDWQFLAGVRRLGLTAGASAPEVLVEEVLDALRARYAVTLEELTGQRETVAFRLPAALADA